MPVGVWGEGDPGNPSIPNENGEVKIWIRLLNTGCRPP